MPCYFAYGSNMNPARMRARGVLFTGLSAAYIDGIGLRFNKVSRRNADWACANLVYAPGERVEGVLYRLAGAEEIAKLDEFEGTPRYYSRERFEVSSEQGPQTAWTYIANPAVIDNHILPLRWYVQQLLEGAQYLSPAYVRWLQGVTCHSQDHAGWG